MRLRRPWLHMSYPWLMCVAIGFFTWIAFFPKEKKSEIRVVQRGQCSVRGPDPKGTHIAERERLGSQPGADCVANHYSTLCELCWSWAERTQCWATFSTVSSARNLFLRPFFPIVLPLNIVDRARSIANVPHEIEAINILFLRILRPFST
jgi:hypothetical protein